MNVEDFRTYCLSLPGSVEKLPFERFFRGRRTFLAFYAAGRMYCFFDLDRFDFVSLRCPAGQAEELRAECPAVGAPYNLSPRRWIGVRLDADVSDEFLKRLVRMAYEEALRHPKTLKEIEGKLFADSYEFRSPRVQLGDGMAVLTFQLFAKTTLLDMAYNCIEMFRREEDGEWRVVHSTWSFIRPLDKFMAASARKE